MTAEFPSTDKAYVFKGYLDNPLRWIVDFPSALDRPGHRFSSWEQAYHWALTIMKEASNANA